MKSPDSPMFIERTLKNCMVIDSQSVYARRQDDGSWEIENIKGKPFVIPAEKLYHPMSEYLKKPTWFRLWKCNRRIRHWSKKMGDFLRTPEVRSIKNIREISDKYGVYVTVFNKPSMGFKVNREAKTTKYFFQYREEDFARMVELLSSMVPPKPVKKD